MGFVLFILVNGALFIRPAEIFEGLRGVSLYEYCILACLFVSALPILGQMMEGRFWQQPLTLLVFGLLAAVVLASASHGDLDGALTNGVEFLKVVIYYLLLVTLVNTPGRLRAFVFWLTVFAAVLTLLSVLQYHQVIQLSRPEPQLVQIGRGKTTEKPREAAEGFQIVDRRNEGSVNEEVVVRLAGTGIFNDPNDLCLLFVIAIPLCLYWIIDGRMGLFRLAWIGPLVLFGYALYLTHSRGGFVAVLFSVVVLLWARFGARTALVLITALVPAMFLAFAGRATELGTGDTAQERFQLWNETFAYLKESPIFGVGVHGFEERARLVAHNSFMHCYGELGLFGGTLFFAAFAFALWALWRLNSRRAVILDPVLRRWNPYLLAIIAGYFAIMMSLSRSYLVPTYMALGLVTVQLQIAVTQPALFPFRLEGKVVQRLCMASAAFLVAMYLAMRILVRYS
jgi:hypothetical protein